MSQVIGVAVPCKNEEGTLRACLTALQRQEPPVARTVVVDNGSTDSSPRIARELAEVLELPEASISAMRNRGAQQLGPVDFVGFVDADVVVGADWLRAALAAAADGADVVGSRSLPATDATWVAARWAEVERHRVHDDSLLWSQHLLVRREVFEALGGFDETMRTGEDADLSARARALGYEVRNVPGMVATHHGFPSTLRGFLRRERWHTSTPGWFARMNPASRSLVLATAGWVLVGLGAAVVTAVDRRPRRLRWWLAGSVAGVPALGRVAGGSFRHSVADGTLLGLWSLVRVSRLLPEAVSRARVPSTPGPEQHHHEGAEPDGDV